MLSSTAAASSPALIACPECDLLQREIVLPAHGAALCRRCGAQLYRRMQHGLDYALAFNLSSVLFFVLANVFPIVRLEVQGNQVSATLFGAVQALISQDMVAVASLVGITTLAVPALEIGAMLYILAPLKTGRAVRGVPATFRFVETIRPWGMVEVFMLGILVSVVKLSALADVIPGIALWSFGALMLSLSATAHFFNPRDLWQRVSLHE